MKYGVVGTRDLRADLRQWHWVYLAGRMHKPVCFLAGSDELRDDVAVNVRAGLDTALLMLPAQFEEQTLYEARASALPGTAAPYRHPRRAPRTENCEPLVRG
jgi:translocator assembly and maintenance protein 41